MASYEIERPQYTIRAGEGHVRIDDMLPERHSAIMVLSSLVDFDGTDGDGQTLEGITGIINGDIRNKGQLYDTGTVIIQTEGRDDMAEHVDAWLQNFYMTFEQQLQLSTAALSSALGQRKKQ
jgi:hypothetical protein